MPTEHRCGYLRNKPGIVVAFYPGYPDGRIQRQRRKHSITDNRYRCMLEGVKSGFTLFAQFGIDVSGVDVIGAAFYGTTSPSYNRVSQAITVTPNVPALTRHSLLAKDMSCIRDWYNRLLTAFRGVEIKTTGSTALSGRKGCGESMPRAFFMYRWERVSGTTFILLYLMVNEIAQTTGDQSLPVH